MMYIIRELKDMNSEREGYYLECSDLSTAKRLAARKQVFYGTVLTIEHGHDELLSYKEGAEWIDV